ncbi:MAG: T9SS type A sorting domain-containing protein [Bacteroidetes bacterium]|nr:T9SS type A sorting domain-containing protein [Bacteroidota bacterium]
MKKMLHYNFLFPLKSPTKYSFLLAILFIWGSVSFAQNDIPVDASHLKLVKTFKINERGTQGTLVVDPNALYSNVTTFSGSAYPNGGATLVSGNTITTLVADSLGLIGTNPFSVGQFKFAIGNLNAVDVSARPRIRFYANDGTNGGPGTYITGFSFNPITFTASSIQVYTGNVAPFAITTQAIWAGITFDDNTGATGITADQLNNLGMGLFNPTDVGTSTDDFFQTDAAGSFLSNNPAGKTYGFGGSPVANFGWEIVSSIPLPVTLTNFNARKGGVSNTLTWSTSQEINSNYFSIQRSEDGTIFSEIGKVNASGNSTTIRNYSYVDVKPVKGINYYRIKMVDKDNSGKYSDIRNVRNDALLVFSIYPNPVSENLILEWNSVEAGKAAITITDEAGRVFYNNESIVNSGNNKLTIEVAKFAKGIYNIKVKQGADSYLKTFSKL